MKISKLKIHVKKYLYDNFKNLGEFIMIRIVKQGGIYIGHINKYINFVTINSDDVLHDDKFIRQIAFNHNASNIAKRIDDNTYSIYFENLDEYNKCINIIQKCHLYDKKLGGNLYV